MFSHCSGELKWGLFPFIYYNITIPVSKYENKCAFSRLHVHAIVSKQN